MERLFGILIVAWLIAPVGGAAPLVDDDAGSGRDAGNGPASAVPVTPGFVYTGRTIGPAGDAEDWYAFHANQGDRIETRLAAFYSCGEIRDPQGNVANGECAFILSAGTIGSGHLLEVTAHETGTWYFRYTSPDAPQQYRFSVGVNGAAPPPTLLPDEGAGGALPAVTPASQEDDHVVIAVVDTGINPYHTFFRAPDLTDAPSRWIPGFPGHAQVVNLTLDAATVGEALEADAAEWGAMERTTYDEENDTYDTHLYTFPGTRVVGAVSLLDSTPDWETPVFDDNGHGTASAGLAAGANLPEADGNVLIVTVEVDGRHVVDGVRWAARQPYVDAISVSWGEPLNAPLTFGPAGNRDGIEWATLEAAESGKPVFVSSGNGFTGLGVGPEHCPTYTSPFLGPTWITRVGAAHAATGNPTWWHCVPVEVVAKTRIASPTPTSMDGSDKAGGTSASAPNTAGHFAHLLLEARRHDLHESRPAVLQHLLNASRPAPTVVGPGHDPSTETTAPLDQGYGLVDAAALDRAKDTLLSGSEPTPRPELDTWWRADHSIREALWGPGSATDGVFGAWHTYEALWDEYLEPIWDPLVGDVWHKLWNEILPQPTSPPKLP